jgi:hypothetical protein
MPITSTQFLTIVDATQPNSVNIWYSDVEPLTVYGLTIPVFDNNGNDSTQLLSTTQQINITINGYNYTFVIQSRSSRTASYESDGESYEVTYYFFETTPVTINSLADDTSIILSQLVIAVPDTTSTIFFGGDYDALLNNVQDNRQSTNIMVADRYKIRGGPGSLNPTNIDDLITLTAQKADIQDSNYSTTGWINGRYEGTPTDSTTYGGLDSALTGRTFQGSYFPSSITTESINRQISSSNVIYTDYLSTSQEDLPSKPEEVQVKYITNGTSIISDSDNKITIQVFDNSRPEIYIGDIITMNNNLAPGSSEFTFTEYMRVENIRPLFFTFGLIELTVTRRWNNTPFGVFGTPSTRGIRKIVNLTKVYQLRGNKIQGISKGRLIVKDSSDILTIDGLGQIVVA